MGANATQQTLNTLGAFLKQVEGQVKTAEEARSEPGGGPHGAPASKHPSKDVSDNLHAATTGAQAADNEKRVKEDQGAAGVDSTPEAKSAALLAKLAKQVKGAEGAVMTHGSAADDQLQIGTNKQPTGKDPSVETASVEAGKPDGQATKGPHGASPTTHPARTDNDELNGGKYAADTPLRKLAEDMASLGERICVGINNLANGGQIAAPAVKQASQQRGGIQDPVVAYQAGWELAAILGGTMDKQASEIMVRETLAGIMKEASEDADNVIAYYAGRAQQVKNAEGGPMIPPEQMAGAPPGGGAIPTGPGDPSMGGGMGGGGGGGEGGGNDEGALLAALHGGGGGGEGGPPGGGAPGGGGGGEGGGHEAELQHILQLMEQEGIQPEELEALLSQQEGGGGGGGDPAGDAGAGDAGAGAAGGGGKTAAQKRSHVDKKALADVLMEYVNRSRKK